MRETSIASYVQLQPVLGKRQQQVLAVFQKYPSMRFSDRELSLITHLPINRVTPRRGELASKGLIDEAGTMWDRETSRRVTAWKLRKPT